LKVLGDESDERRRFSHASFPKNPDMAQTVGWGDAEEAGVTVVAGLAQDGQVVCGGKSDRSQVI
jgi:hypothetical protein